MYNLDKFMFEHRILNFNVPSTKDIVFWLKINKL